MKGCIYEINILECKWTSCLRKKGFEDFFKEADADIFCVQETKLQEGQIDFAPEGYECYWNYAEKKVTLAQQYLQRSIH